MIKILPAEVAEHAEGKRPKSQGIMKKDVPSPTVSGSAKLSRDFQKKTSAFSASSRFILLFPCAEDPGEERALFPKGEKDHKPQRSGRAQRG
jgi:hypothetical protein